MMNEHRESQFIWAVGLRASGTEQRHQVVYGGRRPSVSPGARGASRVIVREDRWPGGRVGENPLGWPYKRAPFRRLQPELLSVLASVSSRFFPTHHNRSISL
jgi:hypothetical protein